MPIDIESVGFLSEGWIDLRSRLIRQLDTAFGFYDQQSFRCDRFELPFRRPANAARLRQPRALRRLARGNRRQPLPAAIKHLFRRSETILPRSRLPGRALPGATLYRGTEHPKRYPHRFSKRSRLPQQQRTAAEADLRTKIESLRINDKGYRLSGSDRDSCKGLSASSVSFGDAGVVHLGWITSE